MIFADQIQNDVQHMTSKVMLLSKVVWPALATLVPAGVTSAFAWSQNHSRNRRSTELTERISALAKIISELPDIPITSTITAATPRSALTAELESAVHELTILQTRKRHHFTSVSSLTTRLRAALLLFWPKGWIASALQITFYLYSVFLLVLFAVIADMVMSKTDPLLGKLSDPGFYSNLIAALMVCIVLGIPPLIIRYFAARIHHSQWLEALARAPHATATPITVPAAPSGQGI